MHSWQDAVLAVGSLVFAVVYASLSLWYATFTTTLAASLWIVLAIQKILRVR